jgi:hypothetical protein
MEENEYNNVVNRQIVRDVVVDLLYFTRWLNQKELSKKSGRKVTWCTPTKDPHFETVSHSRRASFGEWLLRRISELLSDAEVKKEIVESGHSHGP